MAPALRPSRGRDLTSGLILAADHRARGVITVERYADYLAALTAALEHSDGILASAQPLADLAAAGALRPHHKTYLSINRTGLAGSAFELDDRLVATVARAARDGWTGIKHMTRIDLTDPTTAPALELLGQVLEDARQAGLEALIEAVPWTEGRMGRDAEAIVHAAIVAHDMGAPILKVPMPDAASGKPRVDAVGRIVGSVGVPVLFLGGPHREGVRDAVLDEVGDAISGGASGMAMGRIIFQDADPGRMAQQVADVIHGRQARRSHSPTS